MSALPAGASHEPWGITFDEVSGQAGVVFQTAGEMHDPTHADTDWPAFPEITGAGACWADFTGDGYDDLYIANQRYNEMNPYAQGFNALFDPTNRFYVNNGDGTFTDRTRPAGLEGRSFDFGCSAADYDADGHVDLLVYGWGHVTLYRNQGDGTFKEETQQAGLDVSESCLPYECWTSCSAWADYNHSGWLDLFVCTFVESSMEDSHRSPGAHIAQLNFLFRNNGDGTFTEVAHEAGVQGVASDNLGSKSWGAVWFDANLNGWMDLYVANDQTPNEFYWNNGDGTFTRDDDAGLYDGRAGMGVASGDTTRNGYPDLYFTHYQAQTNGYFVNSGNGKFVDFSGKDELSNDQWHVGWGTHFVDLDRDGWLDVMAVNGHTEFTASSYDQDTLVFQHEPQEDGSMFWVDRTDDSGPGVLMERVSRGAAFADYDLDGNVDLLIGNNANQSAQLLRGSGNTNHWVYVQPVQAGPNHQAVGARVALEADGVVQSREVQAGSSFLSQNTLLLDFGVGRAQQVDRVTVHWPGGGTTVIQDLPVDHVIRVDRETGSWVTDTLSPVTKTLFNGVATDERWFSEQIELSFVAEDRAVGEPSGVAYTEYRIAGGPWQEYTGQVLVFPEEEINHTVRFRSVDHAGNTEPLRTERFGIDLSEPVVTHRVEGVEGSNGWWLEAALVLDADDPVSGVDEVRYRRDGGPWLRYLDPVPLGEGVHEVEYKAIDVAGNVSPVGLAVIRVDATPPELAFVRPVPGGVFFADTMVADLGAGPVVVVTDDETGLAGPVFTVEATAWDGTSGVDRVWFFLNGQGVGESRGPGQDHEWAWDTSGHPAGTYLLQVVVSDRAGNTATASVFVSLVPASASGVLATISQGPSLYPLDEGLSLPP